MKMLQTIKPDPGLSMLLPQCELQMLQRSGIDLKLQSLSRTFM